MDCLEKYKQWLEKATADSELAEELAAMTDDDEDSAGEKTAKK